jgi:hypothetical protein
VLSALINAFDTEVRYFADRPVETLAFGSLRFGVRPALYLVLKHLYLGGSGALVCENDRYRRFFESERAGQRFCTSESLNVTARENTGQSRDRIIENDGLRRGRKSRKGRSKERGDRMKLSKLVPTTPAVCSQLRGNLRVGVTQQSQRPGHAPELAKSFAELYYEAGITELVPFGGADNSDVSVAGRLMAHWADLNHREPTVKIVCRPGLYADKPVPGLYNWH